MVLIISLALLPLAAVYYVFTYRVVRNLLEGQRPLTGLLGPLESAQKGSTKPGPRRY